MKTGNNELHNKRFGDTRNSLTAISDVVLHEQSKEYISKLRKQISGNDTHYRVLEMAEHVMRKVETDILIAGNAGTYGSFEILSDVCDRYNGWLNDDYLIWEFIDGSMIRWNRETNTPELVGYIHDTWISVRNSGINNNEEAFSYEEA